MGRTTQHEGHAVSQRVRKRIDEVFGWAETIAALVKAKLRGMARNAYLFTFMMATYKLVRIPRLVTTA